MLKYGVDAELVVVAVAVAIEPSSSSHSQRRTSVGIPMAARDLLSPLRRISFASPRPPKLSLRDASAGALALLRAWALLCLARCGVSAGMSSASEVMLAIALAAALPGAAGVLGVTILTTVWNAIAEPFFIYAEVPLCEAATGFLRAAGAVIAPPARATLRTALRAALPRASFKRLVEHKEDIAVSLLTIRKEIESRRRNFAFSEGLQVKA